MTHRFFFFMGTLLAAALTTAGCGGDDTSVSGNGGSGNEGGSGPGPGSGATGPGPTSSSTASVGHGGGGAGGEAGNGGQGGGVGGGHGGGQPDCANNADCDDANPCTTDTCNAGACEYNLAPNGTGCDDADLCTSGDACTDGSCKGTPKACDDSNVCTDDSCDPATGNCVPTNNTAVCDDGNACTATDACAAGVCVGTGVLDCNDDNSCTTDTCSGGCVNTALPNGTPCMNNGKISTCSNGTCPLPGCTPSFPLACAQTDSWNTANFGSTDTITKYPCNPNVNETYVGSEYTYSFVAPATTMVTVDLNGAGGNTDLLVIQDNAGACEPNNCIAFGLGGAPVTFAATQGTTYYFVVDSITDTTTAYSVTVSCGMAEVCNDGMDNDFDGATDCLDTDCLGVDANCPKCVPQQQGGFTALVCPSDGDAYNNVGEPDNVSKYSCNAFNYANAGEFIYTYQATTNTNVTVTLSGETAPGGNTDLLVLEDTGLGCNPASCITWGFSTASFPATVGKTYYIVIDGFNGAEGNYSLAFSCN